MNQSSIINKKWKMRSRLQWQLRAVLDLSIEGYLWDQLEDKLRVQIQEHINDNQ